MREMPRVVRTDNEKAGRAAQVRPRQSRQSESKMGASKQRSEDSGERGEVCALRVARRSQRQVVCVRLQPRYPKSVPSARQRRRRQKHRRPVRAEEGDSFERSKKRFSATDSR